jgi:hypothetical protein
MPGQGPLFASSKPHVGDGGRRYGVSAQEYVATEEWAALESYRAGVLEAARSAGEQAALEFDPSWADMAWSELVDLARSGYEFSADDLIARTGPAPSPGAIGAVIRQASRTGLITATGYQTSKRVSRHNGVQRIWIGRRSET